MSTVGNVRHRALPGSESEKNWPIGAVMSRLDKCWMFPLTLSGPQEYTEEALVATQQITFKLSLLCLL
jgi:hypothetical protein